MKTNKDLELEAEKAKRAYSKRVGGNLPGPGTIYEHGYIDGVKSRRWITIGKARKDGTKILIYGKIKKGFIESKGAHVGWWNNFFKKWYYHSIASSEMTPICFKLIDFPKDNEFLTESI